VSTLPRRFHLVRHQDVTGMSGKGVVAGGVQWPDGTVVVRWYGEHASTVVWANLDDAIAVHGHGGLTEVAWLDDEACQPLRAAPATATLTVPSTTTASGGLFLANLHRDVLAGDRPDDPDAGVPAVKW
jgi:hypothetical protein